MTPIKQLPDLPWTENSRWEIDEVGAATLFEVTDAAWRIEDLLVVGLIYENYLTPPWFWFALTTNIKFRDLVSFKDFEQKIPKGTRTAVAADFPSALRFAKFYGFTPTGEETERSGRKYLVFRRV